MPEDYFEKKVTAAATSVIRTRTVFLIANVATVLVVAANFNLYFSWLRNMIDRPVEEPYREVLRAIAHARVEDTAIISVPLIGIKFFAADIGLLSGLAMLVLAVWMYYSFRREQHTVATIALEVVEKQEAIEVSAWKIRAAMLEKAQYLLYALSSAFVFTTARGRQAIGDPESIHGRPELRITRWIAAALIWAPFWTVALSLAVDIGSLFFPSVILSGPPLGIVLKSKQHVLEVWVRFISTGVLALVIGMILRQVTYYQIWISKVYNALGQAVQRAETDAATPSRAARR